MELFNVLLQNLDEGHVTDGQGRTVNFKNTIVILTSNIGSQAILETAQKINNNEEIKKVIKEDLRKHFKPEFLNRIDDQIVFESLTKEELQKIVELQVEVLNRRVSEQSIKLEVSKEALNWIVNKSYEPTYGARPIKRAIQQELETPIAKAILKGNYQKNSIIKVYLSNDKLELR